MVVPLDPRHLLLQPARAELAGPHAPYFLRGDERGLVQDADTLLHAREAILWASRKARYEWRTKSGRNAAS
jgi:hypothetical protein